MLGIIDTQGGGLEAAEGGGGAEAGSGGRVRQAEAEMKKECRLPTAFACHCQLLWFISSETFLRQDLQLRHPCSSCAVLSRGFRGSDFGGFRALEAQACSLSCVCCSSSFAHHARPNSSEIRRSVLRLLRWRVAAVLPRCLGSFAVLLSVTCHSWSALGAWGHICKCCTSVCGPGVSFWVRGFGLCLSLCSALGSGRALGCEPDAFIGQGCRNLGPSKLVCSLQRVSSVSHRFHCNMPTIKLWL